MGTPRLPMRFWGAAVPPLIVLLAGCAGTAPTTSGRELTGTFWGLVEIDGNTFPEYQGTRQPHVVFRREDAGISGFAGCNNMAGSYETSGDRLRVGPLSLTRMACLGPEATAMESAFVRGLDETASYRITGRTLELRDASGSPRILLEARGVAR